MAQAGQVRAKNSILLRGARTRRSVRSASSGGEVMSSPAGWYPQPDGRQRYWDGHRWTDHFAPGPGPAAQARAAASRPARSRAVQIGPTATRTRRVGLAEYVG